MAIYQQINENLILYDPLSEEDTPEYREEIDRIIDRETHECFMDECKLFHECDRFYKIPIDKKDFRKCTKYLR